MPGGFFRIAADWWWKLAYALTAMMALVGSVLAETEVRNVGLLLLATVLVLDVARRLLGTLMVLGEGWLRRVLTLLGVMALLLLGAGVGIVIDRRAERRRRWRRLAEPGPAVPRSPGEPALVAARRRRRRHHRGRSREPLHRVADVSPTRPHRLTPLGHPAQRVPARFSITPTIARSAHGRSHPAWDSR